MSEDPNEPESPAVAESLPAESKPESSQDSRSRRRLGLRAAAVIPVILFLALLGWATFVPASGESLVASISAGKTPTAPSFELPILWRRLGTWPPELGPATADGRVALEELRGHPVVLNFWASWCIPCREEAPILNASARVHRGEVAFVGIDVKDLRSDALSFLREFDVPYVSVRDRGDGVFDAYGLTGVPETYYLDSGGRIVSHTPGPITQESLEAGIRAAQRTAP